MFLNIGEGLLVKKKDIIAIFDARKAMEEKANHPFFQQHPGTVKGIDQKVKSFVMVDNTSGETIVLVLRSGIASATLMKRFHESLDMTMDIESREMNGKPTKQLQR